MALTRQQIRLAVCGTIAAFSTLVLFFYRPEAWAEYVTWLVARIGSSVFIFCFCVFAIGFILMAFSHYRRKPELLAAALALSAALHLLLVATFSFWELGVQERVSGEAEVRLELTLGLPSSIENMFAQQMREESLTPLVRDEQKVEAKKTSVAEKEIAKDVPPTPSVNAFDRDPSAMKTMEVIVPVERRVDVGGVPNAMSQTEAKADMEQMLKIQPIKMVVEPQVVLQVESRQFEAAQAVVKSVAVNPIDDSPVPNLPMPDRAVRVETLEIKRGYTAPLRRAEEQKQMAEVALNTVKLDVRAMMEIAHTTEATAQTVNRRSELVVAEPRIEMADTLHKAMKTPVISMHKTAADSQAIPQTLEGPQKRDQPNAPREIKELTREIDTEVTPLINKAEQAQTKTFADSQTRQPKSSSVEILAASRVEVAALSVAEVDGKLRKEQPVLSTLSSTAATAKSLASVRAVSLARQVNEPRVMENAMDEVPRRTEDVEQADSVRMQMALLRTLAASTGEVGASTNTVQRELAAGRVTGEAFLGRESSVRVTPDSKALRAIALQRDEAQTLVDASAQLAQKDTTRRVAVKFKSEKSIRATQDDAGAALNVANVRQVQIADTKRIKETTHERGTVPLGITGVARSAVGTATLVPTPERMTAPLVASRSIQVADGSIASTSLQSGKSGRAMPVIPEVGVAVTGERGITDIAQTALMAGRVQSAKTQRGDGVQSEEALAHNSSALAGTLAVARVVSGADADGVPATKFLRPALAVSGASERGEGTLANITTASVGKRTVVRGSIGVAVAPLQYARTMEDGGMAALPVAAGSVGRVSKGEVEVSHTVSRAVDFQNVARAKRGTQDDSPTFTAPQGGWKLPPTQGGRDSSGVRLAPETRFVAGRQVGAGRSEGVGAVADVGAVRRLMSDDMERIKVKAGKKAIYALRAPDKRRLIEDLGGSPETETAVEQALIWLAGAQSDDGHWDVAEFKGVKQCGGAGDRSDGNVAVTGLSLLAYLGAGYTHMSGKHKETVRKGLEWLIKGQNSTGDLRRGGTMYDQAMATAAICESSSLTSDRQFVTPARMAAGFIMNAQTFEAAWRYDSQAQDGNDTSVLGWQILALKSAEISGVEISQKHYAWARMWLNKVRKGGGGLYSYMPGHGPTPVMTAEGWFCQLFMGEDVRHQGQQESIAYLLENLPEWNEKGRGTVHLYYWYYATLALRLSDAPEFEIWNKALKTALLSGHRRVGPAAGSWDPVCQLGPRGGRIYSTAMATLCLQVYYRYLPFYRHTTTAP